MTPRLSGLRWLALLLLLACTAQTAVVVVHRPVSAVAGERHDPGTCGMCQLVSQTRAQSCAAPPASIPVPADVVLRLAEIAYAAPGQPAPLGPAPRAPPRSPIA